MRVFSAADAVSPAIQRTRDFLFRPFKWSTFLKLGLVAIITEGLGSNFHGSTSSHTSSSHGPVITSPFHITHAEIAVVVAALLLAMLLSAWVFYLITRLRFAYFHCLVTNTKEIRPGWWLYREQATRFFWLNLGVGLGFLAVIIAIALPFISGFVKLARETHQGGPFDWGLLLSLILPLIPILILLVLAGVLSDLILRDWMLPHYALEDASAGEAWSEVWNNIMAEKKQFFVYVLLRCVLPFIASVCVFMILAIPGAALLGAGAALEYGLHSAFADATGASAVVGVLLQVFFGVVAFGLTLLASICLGGPLSTGTREYALLFYGGHYRALGDILYPPTPPTTPTFGGTPGIA
ncbi:MAG: hypothetical protein ABR923_18000 [Terracidiphilus sp.]